MNLIYYCYILAGTYTEITVLYFDNTYELQTKLLTSWKSIKAFLCRLSENQHYCNVIDLWNYQSPCTGAYNGSYTAISNSSIEIWWAKKSFLFSHIHLYGFYGFIQRKIISLGNMHYAYRKINLPRWFCNLVRYFERYVFLYSTFVVLQ